jgi:lysozyme family protein
VSVLTRDNGAVTLAGTAAQVLGALTRIGASTVMAATSPLQAGAAAIAVVAVGGVVYLCSG